METFIGELERLLNRYSKEQDSNTPDFVLAQFLHGCLDAYNAAAQARSKWFGRDGTFNGEQIAGRNPSP